MATGGARPGSSSASGGWSPTGGVRATGGSPTSGAPGAAGAASRGGATSVMGGGGASNGGADSGGASSGGASSGGAANGCPPALSLECGDSFNHSTLVQGRPNTWGLYSSTQRAESGRETIYSLSTARDCAVVVHLKNLTIDLDLLRVPTCDSISSDRASSTPIDLQTEETLSWTNPASKAYYVVVDGYAGAEGSYTLEVECTCN